MILSFFRYLFLLIFFVLVSGALGIPEILAEDNSQAWILRGKELSDKGQFEKASEAFQKAIQLDPASESAYLNLGNAYYELKSYSIAADAFRDVISINPNNSTALFYLGLSLIQQKKYAESVPYFEKAGFLDPDFRQLSLFYIGEAQSEMGNIQEASNSWNRAIKVNPSTDIARKTGTLVKKLTQDQGKTKKAWSLSMSTGVEYDDNVTVSLQDLATGVEDVANIFEFSGDYKFLQTSKFELQAGYDFYQSLYHDLSEFDLQSHIFSLGGGHKFDSFDVDVFTSYNRTTLGGEDFMENYSIAPQIGFFPTERWFALISYSFEDFQFFNDSARDGKNHGVGMDHFIFFMKGKSYLLFSYRYEEKRTTGDEFTYGGHFGTVGIKTPIPLWDENGTFKIAYRYFNKDYKNVTPSLLARRRDERHTVQVSVSQPLNSWLQLNLKYEFIDSVSNLRQIDFTENIASLGLSVTF